MNLAHNITSTENPLNQSRLAVDNHPSIFTEIFKEDVNIAIWSRQLSDAIEQSVNDFLHTHHHYEKSIIARQDTIYDRLMQEDIGLHHAQFLGRDISELVKMFCLLFDRQQVGLRLTLLDKAMCPRFHVDRVPCRLVSTYHGIATEWLPHKKADRSKLGMGSNGLIYRQSGLYKNDEDIQKLNFGDVALLKGECWEGNEGAGLIHRSPNVAENEKRLLVTIDFDD